MPVSVLRQGLREQGWPEQATVQTSDLPHGTPTSGNGKADAVKEVLRRRLAHVWALPAAKRRRISVG